MTHEPSPELFAFADEGPTARLPEGAGAWHILVVDDEPAVHDATLLALRGLAIEDRALAFQHAYSAAEAMELVRADQELAVLLLDVVMETDRAGLDLVREIRETMGRAEVRIILRTGQPGYAPEVDTIRQFDINDYKTKAELTRTRLFTSLTVAIRSYRQLRQSEAVRQGLETIIAAGIDLGREHGVRAFADGVVTQLCALLGTEPEGLVCATTAPGVEPTRVLAAAGQYSRYIGEPLDRIPNAAVVAVLERTLAERRSVLGTATCLYLPVPDAGGIAAYVGLHEPLDDIDRKLIEVFTTNLVAGFENAYLQQKIFDLAYLDPLLGIPNRNSFKDWVDRLSSPEHVVALIDLDSFSDINSILDQSFGDQVLAAVAERISQRFHPLVRVARLSTDVFGLFGPAQAVTSEAIAAVFTEPFQVGDYALRLSATSGLTFCAGESASGDSALRNASSAVKQAKLSARSQAVFYDPEQSRAAKNRLLLLSDLRSAFSSDRLFLAYQPFVELATGRVVGAEALLRWRSEDGAFIPPDRFIPLAEESGLMVPMGEWILRTALGQLKAMTDAGCRGFRMAVNVSHTQFREPGFVESLAQALEGSGVDPSDLEIELTESVAIEDIAFIVATLRRIRELGVTIAIDDFGTGYSSLSVISELPVQRLKIDRSFVQKVTEDSSIARLVIGLARQLDLETIAEGIETAAQCELVRSLGCEDGQGWLFSKPLPPDELKAFVQARPGA